MALYRRSPYTGELIPQVLPVLPRGPWISAGRVFDYSGWEARERFRELDLAIQPGRARDAMASGRSPAAIRQALSRARRRGELDKAA
jgi:hypothetical protein